MKGDKKIAKKAKISRSNTSQIQSADEITSNPIKQSPVGTIPFGVGVAKRARTAKSDTSIQM